MTVLLMRWQVIPANFVVFCNGSNNNNNKNNATVQDALILLRASFSATKVLHLLRCSPSLSHPSLERFDALLKQAIQRITNSVLSDLQWIQSETVVLEWDVCLRSHFPPFWLLRQAHFPPGRHPDWVCPFQQQLSTVLFGGLVNQIWWCSRHYWLNNQSGIALACSNPKLKWRPVWLQHTIEHHSWQPLANTVEIGCLRCS